MNILALVAELWAHGEGGLSDVQETELFRELIDSPLWFRLNAAFQDRVLAKLGIEFTYDAIDLMPYHFRVYWFAVCLAKGPDTISFWFNYRSQQARLFQPAYDMVRLY